MRVFKVVASWVRGGGVMFMWKPKKSVLRILKCTIPLIEILLEQLQVAGGELVSFSAIVGGKGVVR